MIDYAHTSPRAVARRAALSLLSADDASEAAESTPFTPPAPSRRQRGAPRLQPEDIHAFVASVFGEDLHAKRVLSLTNGVVGVLHWVWSFSTRRVRTCVISAFPQRSLTGSR